MPHLLVAAVWKWEVRDPRRRSGWRKLTWSMSEDTAAQWAASEGAEVRKVEGSREERRDVAGSGSIPPGTPLRFYTEPKHKE